MLSRVCMIIRSGPLRSMPTRTSYSFAPMDTPFCYPQETPGRVEFHKSQAMGNRLTEITDIAPLVVFLADEGHSINGQTIFANGGYTAR